MPGAAAKSSTVAKLTAAPPVDGEQQSEVDEVERRRLNDAMIELEWAGKVVGKLPKRRGRWTTDAAEFFEDEKFLSAIRELIGPDSWAKVKELCPLVDDLEEFADYAGDVIRQECVP